MKRRLYVTETIEFHDIQNEFIDNAHLAGIPPQRWKRAWLRLLVWARVYREVRNATELHEALR